MYFNLFRHGAEIQCVQQLLYTHTFAIYPETQSDPSRTAHRVHVMTSQHILATEVETCIQNSTLTQQPHSSCQCQLHKYQWILAQSNSTHRFLGDIVKPWHMREFCTWICHDRQGKMERETI